MQSFYWRIQQQKPLVFIYFGQNEKQMRKSSCCSCVYCCKWWPVKKQNMSLIPFFGLKNLSNLIYWLFFPSNLNNKSKIKWTQQKKKKKSVTEKNTKKITEETNPNNAYECHTRCCSIHHTERTRVQLLILIKYFFTLLL